MKNPINKPVGVTGHTATVVGKDMIVLFGYNPDRGVTNLIQVFGLGKWNIHVPSELGIFTFLKPRLIFENVLRTRKCNLT